MQAPAVIRLIGSEGQSEEYVLGALKALLPWQTMGLLLLYGTTQLPRCRVPALLDISVFLSCAVFLQATIRTSTVLSAARGGGMRWTWADAWALCAACLCSRCAAEAAKVKCSSANTEA